MAAHTAGLFRSVRGAKGGFPPWGLFKLRSFNKKSFQKQCFWQCFSNVSSQTDGNLHVFCHKGSKSFQNSAFDSVFVMFPVKHTVIYTFFAITSIQNTCFCSVFNALASKNLQNLAMYNVFSFLAVFPLPESYQNDPKFHFNTLLRSDTQKSSKNVENTTVFWSRAETVFGAPQPAKADIATDCYINKCHWAFSVAVVPQ